MIDELPHNRAEDKGFWCVVAQRLSGFWNFIDKRDIDKHVTAGGIIIFFLYWTIKLTEWGMSFGEHWLESAKAGHNIAGLEVAAVLGAILGPWGLLVGAVLSLVVAFYFKARQ